jgi:hypothetical protein
MGKPSNTGLQPTVNRPDRFTMRVRDIPLDSLGGGRHLTDPLPRAFHVDHVRPSQIDSDRRFPEGNIQAWLILQHLPAQCT